MTVNASTRRAGPYVGTGVIVGYSFDFKVFAASDLRVVRAVIATGITTDLVLDSDYSVSLNADQDDNPGGTVSYLVSGIPTALPTTQTLTIVGNLPFTQPTDITNLGGFYPQVIEDALDRQTMLVQQNADAVSRSLQLNVATDQDFNVQMPAPVPGSYLGWGLDGLSIVNYDGAQTAPVVAAALAQYVADVADASTTGKGDSLVGVKSAATGAVATDQHEVNARRLSPFDFMSPIQIANAKAKVAQDLTTPMAAMASYATAVSAAGGSPTIEWPDAQFSYATSPNWAINRLTMFGVGMAEFKHTGSGVAFLCDTSSLPGFVRSIKIDNILITGNASTTYGASFVRVAACQFSNIRVRGAVTRGFDIRLGVYCRWDTCMNSINADGGGSAASRGFYLGSLGGLATTDCTFVNCIAEGNLIGWDVAEADFNVVVAGTGEACTAYGVAINPLSKGNQFIGMTGEANTTADILDQGRGTVVQGGYFTKLLSFSSAVRPILRDAQCQSVAIDSGTSGASVQNIRFSSFAAGGTFTNSSPNTYPKNVFNGNTSALVFGDSVGRNPTLSLAAITVTASPFAYTNTTNFAEQIIVRSAVGTVTQITLALSGALGSPTTVGGAGGLAAPGIHTLYPGDQLTVSYSGATGSIDMVRRPL